MFNTFKELVDAVLIEIDEPLSSNTDYGASSAPNNEIRRVKSYVNQAYTEVWSSKPKWNFNQFKGSFATVAGQNEYTNDGGANGFDPDADLQTIELMWIENAGVIRKVSPADLMATGGALSTDNYVGVYPGKAALIGQYYRFHPIPNSSETIHYIGSYNRSDLVHASDTPIIPEMFRDVLYWGALWRAKNKENELGLEMQKYEQRLNVLRSFDAGFTNDRMMPELDLDFSGPGNPDRFYRYE